MSKIQQLCEHLVSCADIDDAAAHELEALDTNESNEEAIGLRSRTELMREAEACITLLAQAARDAVEAIERGSSTAPVVECLKSALSGGEKT